MTDKAAVKAYLLELQEVYLLVQVVVCLLVQLHILGTFPLGLYL
ncbi:hypothetical protein LCGC14_3154320 [marine sediment metagenome]|uniref:Uncharacterized protein n=1 Tax=marine sediment metagenome TaxID=412755 RepID=A0A0F8VT42_9ZZZZ